MVVTAVAPPTAEARVRALVEAELAAELARRDRTRLRVDDQRWVYELVGRIVGEDQRGTLPPPTHEESEQLWRRVFAAVTPLGPLAEHLADPEVEEVRINGTEACFVFKAGRRHTLPPPFADEAGLVELVHWYTDGTPSARLDRASPTVTMTLPEGSRLHAALSPPARPMSVTIRRHPSERFRDLYALASSGFLPRELIGFLEAAVASRLNILVSGGAGAGKTTFMRVLARLIGPDERVGRGAITIQMLVHEALRMSPDRIVIGEVRGGEALDLLDAMNTGHPGSICTIHAESPRETLPRLARLALRSPHSPRAETVMSEVVNTVDLVLYAGFIRPAHANAGPRSRRLTSVSVVAGLDDGRAVVRDLVTLGSDGRWHRVGSLAALPERAQAKLANVCDPSRLLDDFDA